MGKQRDDAEHDDVETRDDSRSAIPRRDEWLVDLLEPHEGNPRRERIYRSISTIPSSKRKIS